MLVYFLFYRIEKKTVTQKSTLRFLRLASLVMLYCELLMYSLAIEVWQML
jgi:hypothetical protein